MQETGLQLSPDLPTRFPQKASLSDLGGDAGLSKVSGGVEGSGGRSEGPKGFWCSALGHLPRFTVHFGRALVFQLRA